VDCAEALFTAFSHVISPASAFCHIKPVTLSVIVPSPLSVKDCGFAAGAVV